MRRRSSTDVNSEDNELVAAAKFAAAEWRQQVSYAFEPYGV